MRLQQAADMLGVSSAILSAHRDRVNALKTRHVDRTAPQAIAAFQLFQTPVELAAKMATLLNGLTPLRGKLMLEPSAGLGRLIDAALPYGPRIVAVEANADCHRHLAATYGADHAVVHADFLSMTPPPFQAQTSNPPGYDAVLMNPPFTMRSDLAHLKHALRMLRPGGYAVALLMDSPNRYHLKTSAVHWEHVPPGTFKDTSVGTILTAFSK